MGLRTRLASIIVLATTLASSITSVDQASAAPPPTIIAAVGDSYLAGIGAGRYSTVAGCRRSNRSAPALLARAHNARLIDLTCPGDTTVSASRRASAIPGNTDLVIVQSGGNDIGFAALAGACFLAGTSTCFTTVREGHHRLPEVRRSVLGLVRQIRLTAPTAEVVVLGYPRLLGSPTRCRPLLDAPRVRAVDRLQRTLDRVLRSAARTGGAVFTDWPRSVDRASLCSADPWYAMPGERLDDLLHPDERATRALSLHLHSVSRQ